MVCQSEGGISSIVQTGDVRPREAPGGTGTRVPRILSPGTLPGTELHLPSLQTPCPAASVCPAGRAVPACRPRGLGCLPLSPWHPVNASAGLCVGCFLWPQRPQWELGGAVSSGRPQALAGGRDPGSLSRGPSAAAGIQKVLNKLVSNRWRPSPFPRESHCLGGGRQPG